MVMVNMVFLRMFGWIWELVAFLVCFFVRILNV